MLLSLNPLTNISSCHPKSIGPLPFLAFPMLSLTISCFSHLKFFQKSIGLLHFLAFPMLLSLNPLTNISSCHPKSIGPLHFLAFPMLSLAISCFSQLRFFQKSIGLLHFLTFPMLLSLNPLTNISSCHPKSIGPPPLSDLPYALTGYFLLFST